MSYQCGYKYVIFKNSIKREVRFSESLKIIIHSLTRDNL